MFTTFVSDECAETIRQRCRDFVGGPWTTAKPEDIRIERLGGVANTNFSATLTTNGEQTDDKFTPHKVVIHLYGSVFVIPEGALKYNGEAAEAVITEMLSQKSMAPPVLGVFPGGRIEEYIPSRNMQLSDLEDASLVVELARKLAHIHAFEAPIRKLPDRLEVMLEQVTPLFIPAIFEDAPESEKEYYFKCVNFPLGDEITHVSKIMSKIGGEPVFCHGDLNLNNLLLREGATEEGTRILPVDFEISCYFYRSYDLAYHLGFRNMVAKRVSDESDEFEIGRVEDVHLTRDRSLMIEAYLGEWARLHNGQTCANDTPEHLHMEIEFGELAALLVFCCFMKLFKMPTKRYESFWGLCEDYFKKKEAVIEKYGDPTACDQ